MIKKAPAVYHNMGGLRKNEGSYRLRILPEGSLLRIVTAETAPTKRTMTSR